jgi:hypothetical protein
MGSAVSDICNHYLSNLPIINHEQGKGRLMGGLLLPSLLHLYGLLDRIFELNMSLLA